MEELKLKLVVNGTGGAMLMDWDTGATFRDVKYVKQVNSLIGATRYEVTIYLDDAGVLLKDQTRQ